MKNIATTFSTKQKYTKTQFVTSEASFGTILTACTSQGLRAVFLGDTLMRVEQVFYRWFPNAEKMQSHAGLNQSVAALSRYLDPVAPVIDMPLDILGTPFQKKVWSVLSKIPRGKTMSYLQVAQQIGLPKGARAVASACAANPLALIIPCHRIVAKNKTVSGYRWGVERKRFLLDKELALATGT